MAWLQLWQYHQFQTSVSNRCLKSINRIFCLSFSMLRTCWWIKTIIICIQFQTLSTLALSGKNILKQKLGILSRFIGNTLVTHLHSVKLIESWDLLRLSKTHWEQDWINLAYLVLQKLNFYNALSSSETCWAFVPKAQLSLILTWTLLRLVF